MSFMPNLNRLKNNTERLILPKKSDIYEKYGNMSGIDLSKEMQHGKLKTKSGIVISQIPTEEQEWGQ